RSPGAASSWPDCVPRWCGRSTCSASTTRARWPTPGTQSPGGSRPGGLLVEGTCDELGRLGSWVLLDATGPLTLTLSAKLTTLESPATLAERLPKALIHRNVPGERIHDLIEALEQAWRAAAGYAPFGPRQRWLRTVEAVKESGWPIRDSPRTWRHGNLTLPWPAISPR
ncbi:LOW QUALITY PROTEIN: hypothetical protein MCBG_04422, partial [Micromonospora sp. M42]